MQRFDSALTAAALAAAGAVWLHQALSYATPSLRVLADRAIFLFVLSYAASELGRSLWLRWRRRSAPRLATGSRPAFGADGLGALARARDKTRGVVLVATLAALIAAQTASHVDERSPFLYMTYPQFPTGVGTSADGYVVWLDGRPAYAEAWQFAKLANLLSGASTDRETGDTDARAAYSYLGALLARPVGFVPAFILLNALSWLAACLAVWYCCDQLLGHRYVGFIAALLTCCGQGYVFMAGTPMSYVVGYAWWALLLALAFRWGLFGWAAPWRRWIAWGLVCGVGGLFYFTHVVAVGMAWVFGSPRAPLRGLISATAAAFLVPAAWYAVGSSAIGLGFQETTANDLFGQVRILIRLAWEAPLLLPLAAGQTSLRALLGGFGVPLLALAALGVAVAPPRRRQWYMAVGTCGLAPVLILHMIPVTQRYGYLAYPAIYVAAVEGVSFLARHVVRWTPLSYGVALAACGGSLVALQLFRANADLIGVYRFAVAFGGP